MSDILSVCKNIITAEILLIVISVLVLILLFVVNEAIQEFWRFMGVKK